MAEMLMISALLIGGVVIAIAAYYTERKRQMDWHHKMMLDAWQDGWDAAVSMMQYREEQGR